MHQFARGDDMDQIAMQFLALRVCAQLGSGGGHCFFACVSLVPILCCSDVSVVKLAGTAMVGVAANCTMPTTSKPTSSTIIITHRPQQEWPHLFLCTRLFTSTLGCTRFAALGSLSRDFVWPVLGILHTFLVHSLDIPASNRVVGNQIGQLSRIALALTLVTRR